MGLCVYAGVSLPALCVARVVRGEVVLGPNNEVGRRSEICLLGGAGNFEGCWARPALGFLARSRQLLCPVWLAGPS